ncbi:MAG: MBL fold metallo-hydrolase [Candidatus Bipolaricaulota bacterium]|nr:MAG: MBL fold metallo-hydrolase [Candidatus Bipolaricaulota bacterium]
MTMVAATDSFRFRLRGMTGLVIRNLEDEHLSFESLLGRTPPGNPEATLAMSYSCCFVQFAGRNVLIDAGLDARQVEGCLGGIGIAPAAVSDVLITHGDRDHVLGLMREDGSAAYPGAQCVLHRELWEGWASGAIVLRDEASRLPAALEARVRLVTGGDRPLDGVEVIDAPGHGVGHLAFAMESEDQTLLHVGDALLHTVFVEYPEEEIPAEDDSRRAAETRIRLLSLAAKRGALVAGSHFPFPGLGQVERSAVGFRWLPLEQAQ